MIKGKSKVEFGTGDILITPLVKEDLTKGCLVLQNKGNRVIGEYSPTKDFEKSESDTLITFTKTESIDVLIERLEKLKLMMNGDVEECRTGFEYEF